MVGVAANLQLRPVAPVQPVSFKIPTRILSPLSKSSWISSVSLQSPRKNPLFVQKTLELSDRVRRPQTKVQGVTDFVKAGAEAVLPHIVGKLDDFIANEGKLLIEVHDDLKWIKEELEYLQCFLEDADSKQITDERVGILVAEIRDVSYEVEDAIDTFICSRQRMRPWQGFIINNVKRHFRGTNPNHEGAKQIGVIKQKISDISRRRKTYGIRNINEGRPESSLQIPRRLLAMLEDPEAVGLQEEIKKVRELLMTEEPRRGVISIFGMGGSGKTTLAKKVYHAVKDDFDCHAFICISQQNEIRDVLMLIIERIMDTSIKEREKLEVKDLQKLEVKDLQKKLADLLRENRYLVVIDDVWSMEAWDALKHVLPDGMKKSRVMLTTREREVALHDCPSSYLHEKRLLNNNEGWELFLKTVFRGESPPAACLSELRETGKRIFAKCGGLPLAILVLGSLLSRKKIHVWSKVLQSLCRHLTESPEQYMGILALSYWDLPAHLKPCFLYLGLFPEDYEIDSKKLIRLWIAEGFIQQRGNEIMEDVAEDYVEELVDRSMIQASRKWSDGPIVKIHIHDLLRHLSISEAKQNNLFTILNVGGTCSISPTTNVRRLALHRSIHGYYPTVTLHPLLIFGDPGISHSEFRQAKLLRVMSEDLVFPSKTTSIKQLREFKEFVHLRYLELIAGEGLLPSSIRDLNNPQTLVLHLSPGSLLDTISNLKQLRHLEALDGEVGNLQVNKLTNLQTLCLPIGNWIKDGLGDLTNLRKLIINGDGDLNEETLSDSIGKLLNLRSLALNGELFLPQLKPFTHHSHLYEMSLFGAMKELPELPPNLVELTLGRTRFEQAAISKLEKLSHLKILKLCMGSYKDEKMIFSSGSFPQLEILIMADIPLKEWIIEEGALPNLKSVQLNKMQFLNTQTLPKRVCALLKLDRCEHT